MENDWSETAEGYRLYLISKGYSAESMRSYLGYVVIAWRWFRFRDRPLFDITPRELANFLESMKKGHRPNTVRNCTSSLRCFFRYCLDTGLREDDPSKGFSVRKPKLQPRQPYAGDELQAMFREIEDPRDLAMFMLLVSTGIRIGEVVAVKIQDIDWKRLLLLVQGKGGKERWVPITKRTAQALEAVAGARKAGPLFVTLEGTPMNRERARKRLVAIGERAGVVHVYPHRWRITFANEFLEAGGDMGALQSIMGHANIEQTNHYAGHSRAQRGIEQARKLNLGGSLTA